MDYHGKRFRSVSNTPNGQVTGETAFLYSQHDNILTATYQGGGILQGQMIGLVAPDGSLRFCYQHLSQEGELRSGTCESTPELLTDGRIRLLEKWQWTSGDCSKGESVVEEVIES